MGSRTRGPMTRRDIVTGIYSTNPAGPAFRYHEASVHMCFTRDVIYLTYTPLLFLLAQFFRFVCFTNYFTQLSRLA